MPTQPVREQLTATSGGPAAGEPAKGEAVTLRTRLVPILTFHAIDDESSPISFSPDALAQALERLVESGFQAISLLQAVQAVAGRAAVPERSCVITFDDGYRSVYDVAFPLLQRYGLTATVFLTAGEGMVRSAQMRFPQLNSRAMLSWAEVHELHRHGVEFGAHTLTHPDLRTIPLDRARVEVEGSKQVIEDALGASVASFAYPFGRSTPPVRALAEAHFACACTDDLGIAGPQSDLYRIERVDAYYLKPTSWFGRLDAPLFQWYLRARNVPRMARRALREGASG